MNENVRFLNEAARYFRKRDTGGEDRAFWANINNAEVYEGIAVRIAELETINADLLAAMEKIATGTVEVFDEDLKEKIPASMDEDEMQKIALAALAGVKS